MSDRDTQTDEGWMSIGAAAAELGVTVATVRNWEKAGKITAFRTPGNQRRFRSADVEAMLRPTDA